MSNPFFLCAGKKTMIALYVWSKLIEEREKEKKFRTLQYIMNQGNEKLSKKHLIYGEKNK